MKKLPLVMALAASSLCGAASAQTVQVYGKLYPFLISESGSGASNATAPTSTLITQGNGVNGMPSIKGMVSGNSRLGFRGKEDLGGGLKAVFQVEGVVAVDDGSAAGFAFDRDGFVGLEGSFGKLRLGNMDTIFKEYGDTLGILGVSSGTFLSTSNILRKPGFGTSNTARFHDRRANSIQYESPELSGFQLGIQVSPDEVKTATRNLSLISVGLKYDQGPIYLAIAHEIHNDYFGGSAQARSSLRNSADQNARSKDTATQFTIEWRMNKQHKFELDVIRKNYNETGGVAGRFANYSNMAYQVSMENRWSDKWRTAAHYVKSNAGSCSLIGGAACSTVGLEGSKATFAGSYYLSRRTQAFAGVSKITNGSSARFSSNALANRTNPGEDLTQYAMGLAHSF